MSQPKPIVYYITAHGYGHGVRSCDILRALSEHSPRTPLHVVSGLPQDFLRARLHGLHPMPELRNRSLDVGMVQHDSVRTDVEATLEQVLDLDGQWDRLVAEEAEFLRSIDAAMVVADIPAIPLQAAKDSGLPAIAVGNFAWDWIYSAFVERDPRWSRVVERFRDVYAHSDLLLRLPFHEPMEAFPHKIDTPLLSRPQSPRRAELAAMTGASVDKKWILLSFTTLDWGEAALDRVAALEEYEFFTVRPLAWDRPNIRVVDRDAISFGEVLASTDAVVSKPGYGIVSECVVHEKPLIYADRSDFLEYPILVQAIERLLRHVHIPAEDLYNGELRPSIERVWAEPEPVERMDRNGDAFVAELLLQMHSGQRLPASSFSNPRRSE